MPTYSWKKIFYRSKAWRYVRAQVIQRDMGMCGYCGRNIFDTPVVHHKIALTEANVDDSAVSLNPDLLVTLHEGCHNLVHDKFKANEKNIIVNDDLSIDYSRRMEVVTIANSNKKT
jgi:5-methylcytosine-specific restriction endonuclease McrA